MFEGTGNEMEYVDALRRICSESTGSGNGPPGQVLPHVYIGSQMDAENLRLLRKLRVTHVLNCAACKPHPMGNPYRGLNIHYLEFLAEDRDDYDMTQHFREAHNYLDKVQRKGGVCLVHCYLGINRSAAVVISYVMMNKSMTLLKAAKLVKTKRNVIMANAGFRRQLVRFARFKNLLDPMELEEDDRRNGFVRSNSLNLGRKPRDAPSPASRQRTPLPRALMISTSTKEPDTDKPFTRSYRISTNDVARPERASRFQESRESWSQLPKALPLYRTPFERRASQDGSMDRYERELQGTDYWSGRSEILGDGALMFKFNSFMNRERV